MSSSESESELQSSFDSNNSLESELKESSAIINSEEGNNDLFLGFDETIEPVATDIEWQAYSDAIAAEKEEEEEFRMRFEGEVELQSW